MQGTFDCLVFKFILRSFGAFPILCDFRHSCISKMAGPRANGPKVGPRGDLVYMRYF